MPDIRVINGISSESDTAFVIRIKDSKFYLFSFFFAF